MKSISAAFVFVIALFSVSAHAQSTQISTDYLMTIHIPTERKSIDGNLVVTSKEANDALARGETLADKGMPYFIATPQFQTSSETYDWMNKLQGIAKMAKYKRTKAEAYVEYDVFAAR